MNPELPSSQQISALDAPSPHISNRLVLLLAVASGLTVANIYYAQPLVSLIAGDVGLAPAAASLIVTLTQIGYGIGLLLLVPLADIIENRRLIILTLCSGILALLVTSAAQTAFWFLVASFCIGLGTVTVQMFIPFAAHLSHEASRGKVVGNIVSGLLLGIMLARPVSSLIAHALGWRAVFELSAALMVVIVIVLWRQLPTRYPTANHRYRELIASLWTLWQAHPLLRRRALYQASVFSAFSLYWTAVPLVLSSATFGLTQRGIAFFALAGAAGAISAPIAGRLADQGKTHITTGIAIAMVAIAFALAKLGGSVGSLGLLLAGGILLDLGVQANLVVGQRAIYTLGEQTRGRMNGIYLATFFTGGALGSAVASIAYAQGGWSLVGWIGIAFPILGLLFYATEQH